MLIKDIDKRLDMRLILRLRQNTDLFRATAEVEKPLPVFIFDEGGKVFMNTYFPKSEKIKNLDLMVRKFEAVEMEGSFVTTTRINNVKDLAVIRKLLDLPSVILNRSDMSRGFLNLYIRFHSSQLEKISSLLSEYTSDRENSRIEWLGPSPGICGIMDIINAQYPISVVTYELDVTGDAGLLGLIVDLDVLAEVQGPSTDDGKFRSILYADKTRKQPLPEGLTEISADDDLYTFTLSNRFLEMVRDKSNSSHIVRMRFFVKPQEGKLQVTVFLPSSQVYEYYSILYGVARAENNKVVVRHLLPYSQEVWDFL